MLILILNGQQFLITFLDICDIPKKRKQNNLASSATKLSYKHNIMLCAH